MNGGEAFIFTNILRSKRKLLISTSIGFCVCVCVLFSIDQRSEAYNRVVLPTCTLVATGLVFLFQKKRLQHDIEVFLAKF